MRPIVSLTLTAILSSPLWASPSLAQIAGTSDEKPVLNSAEPKAISDWFSESGLLMSPDTLKRISDTVNQGVANDDRFARLKLRAAAIDYYEARNFPAYSDAIEALRSKDDPYRFILEAERHMRGWETPKDDDEAIMGNFIAAAEAGMPRAYVLAGRAYEQGLGVAKNDFKALDWYLKAALAGEDEGYEHVFRCYRDGIGTVADPDKTLFIALLNADGYDEDVLLYLGQAYATGTGVSRNNSKARQYFEKVISLVGEDGIGLQARAALNDLPSP